MSSSFSIARQSLVHKLNDWVGPFEKNRDTICKEFREQYPSLEKIQERFPGKDENTLRTRREKIISDHFKQHSWQVDCMKAEVTNILRAFDEQHCFVQFYFYTENRGEPNANVLAVDLFEEFGEAQRVSYETYCKRHENVEEEEDPKYLLARIQLVQREVPESIVCLKYLREFVQERLLDRLPRNFGDLHNLRRIDIGQYGCDLSELPEELGHFPHLKYLRIVNTQIKHINGSLFQNTSLEELDLEHNQIQEIDPLIGNLCRLRVFNVNYNCIAFLPDSIGDLKCLQELRWSYNQLKTLPYSLNNLGDKIIVEFAYNIINQLPPFTHPKLQRISKYIGNPIYEELKSQEKVSLDMSKLDLKECK